MDQAQFWFQDGPGGGGDPGDPIGQSLRFRSDASRHLVTSNPTTSEVVVWTYSIWIKVEGGTGDTINWLPTVLADSAVGAAPSNSTQIRFDTYNANRNWMFDVWGNNVLIIGGGTANNVNHPDTSAWYHFVYSYDGTTFRIHTNGKLEFSKDQRITFRNNGDIQIGTKNVSPFRFRGYMAASHFIDGQALDPTTFGRYNANGVWVPVDPQKDGDTAWYGANGFHLTFADPNDIGKDYSGNGNDFTATGFNLDGQGVTGYYCNNVSNAVGGVVPNGGTPYWTDIEPSDAVLDYHSSIGTWQGYMTRIFDGDLSTYAYWGGEVYQGGKYVPEATFDLRDYPSITELSVYNSIIPGNYDPYSVELLDASKTAIPGTRITLTTNTALTWDTIPLAGTPRYLKFEGRNTATLGRRLNLAAIRVNGQILSQESTITADYDLMQDSPTQNYATVNPLSNPDQTAANANLTAQGKNNNRTGQLATIYIPQDRDIYFECVTNSSRTSNWSNWYTGFVISGVEQQLPFPSNSRFIDGTAGFVAELYANLFTNAEAVPSSSSNYRLFDGGTWLGDICGVRINNNRITITHNGAATNVTDLELTQQPTDGFYRFYSYNYGGSSLATEATHYNYGQQPWSHAPAGVTAANALQTANMPADEPPDTITGTFTGNSSADGPFVYTGCIPARIQYGTIDVKYQDRLGQTNVDFLSNGFKIRSTTSNSGTVNYTVTTTHDGGEYDGFKVPFNSPAPAVSN
jgi:hypothetical protein